MDHTSTYYPSYCHCYIEEPQVPKDQQKHDFSRAVMLGLPCVQVGSFTCEWKFSLCVWKCIG